MVISPLSTASLRAIGQRLDLDEPLLRQARLDDGPAALALADRERVVLLGDQESLLLQIGQHPLARFEAVESGIRSGVLVHVRVLVHHVDLRQVVAQSRLKIVGIVRRRDLHRAGAELRLREFVGDDRNLALHQRQQNILAVQMRVALVFRVHGDGSVAEHRLGTRGRDRDELVCAGLRSRPGSESPTTFRPHLRASLRDRRSRSRATGTSSRCNFRDRSVLLHRGGRTPRAPRAKDSRPW